MVAWFRCLLVNEQPHGYGVSTRFSFSRWGLIPLSVVQSCEIAKLRAIDQSLSRNFSADSIAIFNQADLIKILHRARMLHATHRIFAAVFSIRKYISEARGHVAPATGMRELSYSTSPRLTVLVLCAPVDKHDRNNSEKKLSLTPGRVSA